MLCLQANVLVPTQAILNNLPAICYPVVPNPSKVKQTTYLAVNSRASICKLSLQPSKTLSCSVTANVKAILQLFNRTAVLLVEKGIGYVLNNKSPVLALQIRRLLLLWVPLWEAHLSVVVTLGGPWRILKTRILDSSPTWLWKFWFILERWEYGFQSPSWNLRNAHTDVSLDSVSTLFQTALSVSSSTKHRKRKKAKEIGHIMDNHLLTLCTGKSQRSQFLYENKFLGHVQRRAYLPKHPRIYRMSTTRHLPVRILLVQWWLVLSPTAFKGCKTLESSEPKLPYTHPQQDIITLSSAQLAKCLEMEKQAIGCNLHIGFSEYHLAFRLSLPSCFFRMAMTVPFVCCIPIAASKHVY